MLIRAYLDDITNIRSGAIVNAAKQSLEGGGGVDGAIHHAAGPELLPYIKDNIMFVDEEHKIRCPTGKAVWTPSFDLPCEAVVHTVGPVYKDDTVQAPRLLNACYANSIIAATDQGHTHISFPSISTGIYGYPLHKAAAIAVKAASQWEGQNITVDFVCWDEEMLAVYKSYIELAHAKWRVALEF